QFVITKKASLFDARTAQGPTFFIANLADVYQEDDSVGERNIAVNKAEKDLGKGSNSRKVKAVRTVTYKKRVRKVVRNGIGVEKMETFYCDEDYIDQLMRVLRIKQGDEENVEMYAKRYESRVMILNGEVPEDEKQFEDIRIMYVDEDGINENDDVVEEDKHEAFIITIANGINDFVCYYEKRSSVENDDGGKSGDSKRHRNGMKTKRLMLEIM
ncbi:8708_t:CDS:2, partial [Racocetra persica]